MYERKTQDGARSPSSTNLCLLLGCPPSFNAIPLYLTIRPVARMGYYPVALDGEGSSCFSITQLVGRKRQ